MFNHLIPLCWNTTTEHLEVSVSSKCFDLPPQRSWDIYCFSAETCLQGPNSEAWMLISVLCLGLLWISFPMPLHGGCYGHGLDSALQRCGPEEEQETVGSLKWCLGLSHTPQDPPHSAWFAVSACVCTTSHQGGGWGCAANCRSWRKLFRGDSLPLNWEHSINYLHWQMFTDPNMHEFVELAGFPQPNILVFTMRAWTVVILAVLQRALIWAVSTTNHFGGNYFTP